MNGARRTSAGQATCLARMFRGSHGLVSLVLCALLVGCLGLTLHPRLLLLMPALVVLLFVGVGWPWLAVLFIRGRLHFARERVHEGEEIEASLAIRNHAPWPAWGLLFDAGALNRRALETLRPFALKNESFTLQPQQRGAFPEHAPQLRSGFPFGLLTASRGVAVRRPLVVWPRIFPVAAPPDWASADMAVGHVDTRRIGNEGDTIGVREYRRGDPMRWIHWSQTARHDRFMVREFQASGIPRMRIVLDCDADAHVGAGTDSSFEWAVRIAASVSIGWLAEGAEVELVAGPLRLPAAGGARQRTRVLDTLAEVRLQPGGTKALAPRSELATVFISTDLGWQNRPEAPCCAWRGFLLASHGFGGDAQRFTASNHKLVVIERPEEVAAALQRMKRGLADVA